MNALHASGCLPTDRPPTGHDTHRAPIYEQRVLVRRLLVTTVLRIEELDRDVLLAMMAHAPTAGAVDVQFPWRPLLLERGAMRVVDGRHRLAAAWLCGYETVAVIFDEGGELLAGPSARLDGLSPRQREVAELLGQGASNRDICRRLNLSLPTVKQYVSAVLTRLGVSSRVQAALVLRDGALATQGRAGCAVETG